MQPRYRCALTVSLRAIAAALVHCPAVRASMHERGLPGLCILTRWDQRGHLGRQLPRGIYACHRPISGDGAYVLIGRDLVQEFGQHRGISDVAAGDFDCSNLQRFLVEAYEYLTPGTAFGAAMFARIPLAFTFGFLIPVLSMNRFSGPVEPLYGRLTFSVFFMTT
jgi:hypothetical protein